MKAGGKEEFVFVCQDMQKVTLEGLTNSGHQNRVEMRAEKCTDMGVLSPTVTAVLQVQTPKGPDEKKKKILGKKLLDKKGSFVQ